MMNPLELLEARTLLTAGVPDPTFGNGGRVTTDVVGPAHQFARAVALQSDGKVVVAGSLMEGGDDIVLARFNPGGVPDKSFGSGGTTAVDFGYEYATAADVVVDSAGRIVVSGRVDGGLIVARFQADGRVDPTFGSGGKTVLNGNFDSGGTPLVVSADGTILVAAARYDSGYQIEVYRLDRDGRRDAAFADKGVLRPVIANTERLLGMAAMPDGRFVLMGETQEISHEPVMFIARYTAAGAPDTSFAGSGLVNGDVFPTHSFMNALALTSRGQVLVSAKTDDGYGVARFRADGVFDRAFARRGVAAIPVPGPEYQPSRIAVGPAGEIALVGRKTIDNDERPRTLAVARLTAAGALDTSFDGDGIALTPLGADASGNQADFDVAVQPDGKVVVASQGNLALEAIRYTTSGVLDPTFGAAGRATLGSPGPTNQAINALAPLPDGRVLAAGETGGPTAYSVYVGNSGQSGLLVRYRADGSVDPTFGDNGRVISNLFTDAHAFNAVAVLPSGKFLVGGNRTPGGGFVARYNADGRLDTTFGSGGKFTTGLGVHRLLVLPDGRVLVATDRSGADALLCLTSAGAVAPTFAAGASAWGSAVVDLLRRGDGKIVAVLADEVRRLNPDGSPDTTYGVAGTVKLPMETRGHDAWTNLELQAAALGPAGDLFITATQRFGYLVNLMFSWSQYGVLRVTPQGTIDTTFGEGGVATAKPGPAIQMEGGPTNIPHAVAVQPDGKVLVTGEALVQDYYGQAFGTVRFNADGSLDHSFGDDGVVVNRVGVTSRANAMLLADGQRVVVAGAGQPGGRGDDFTLFRYQLVDPTPVAARLVGRTLTITGSPAGDTIRLRVADGQLTIRGVDHAFPISSFSRIEISGLAGDDTLDASASPVPVTLDGGDGRDSLLGGASADLLLGGAGDDTLFGGRGADTLRGGDGNDYLSGGPGADQLFGDAGNDQIFAVDSARDTADGGAGFDRVNADADDLLHDTEGLLA